MRMIRLALAVFAVLAFGAVLAGTASAAEELFLTQSGKELLFLALSETGTLRGLNAGVLGTITCAHDLVHGWALHKSPLAHRVLVTFHGKCEQTINGTKTACTEPIVTKLLLAELGLLLLPGGKKDVVLLVAPSSGTEFVEVICGSNKTKVEGAVIGEFPEVNAKGVNQYNKQLTEYELVFESENKSSENQRYTKLDLLGVEMSKAELKVEGFFGGKASEETTEILDSPTGWIEICIHP